MLTREKSVRKEKKAYREWCMGALSQQPHFKDGESETYKILRACPRSVVSESQGKWKAQAFWVPSLGASP